MFQKLLLASCSFFILSGAYAFKITKCETQTVNDEVLATCQKKDGDILSVGSGSSLIIKNDPDAGFVNVDSIPAMRRAIALAKIDLAAKRPRCSEPSLVSQDEYTVTCMVVRDNTPIEESANAKIQTIGPVGGMGNFIDTSSAIRNAKYSALRKLATQLRVLGLN